VEQAKALIPTDANRRLHVGVMMSYKTLNHIPTATGWERIWPNQAQLRSIFADDPEVFNVLHYADYDDLTDLSHLTAATLIAGPNVHGLQLDMKWPLPTMLTQYKAINGHIKLIVQVGATAMAESTDWERDLAAYEGIADYVLLDSGMGRGKTFSPDLMLHNVAVALKYFDQNQIAVAGGLGPETYLNLKPIVELYPQISCDAQGRLRDSGSAKDPLNMDLVAKYVSGICSLLE
jgi:phosphoribosylanthranilate isomerase